MTRAKTQRRQEQKILSTKSEARNSKQIQMTKKHNVPNNPDSDSKFWIFRVWDLFWPRFVSDFEIRISDLFRWSLGAKNLNNVNLLDV